MEKKRKMMKCTKCQREIEEDVKFCPYCGYPYSQEIQESGEEETGQPEKNEKKQWPSRRKTLIGFAVVCLVLTGALGFYFYHQQQEAERIRQEQIAEAKKKEEAEAAEKKKQEELKKQEEEAKKKQEEEKWNQILDSWTKEQNPKNLKAILAYQDKKEEVKSLTQTWYDGLWENPIDHLDLLIEACDLMEQDQEMKPALQALAPIVNRYGRSIEYGNEVFYEEVQTDGSRQKQESYSRLTLTPVLTRNSLVFQSRERAFPSSGAVLHFDEYAEKPAGIRQITLVESEHDASVENGKLVIRIPYTGAQSPEIYPEPLKIVFDENRMDVIYTSSGMEDGVMYPVDPSNKTTLRKYFDLMDDNPGSSQFSSLFEYYMIDLNHDGLNDICIQDRFSNSTVRGMPNVIFYLADPNGSFTEAGQLRMLNCILISDGSDLYYSNGGPIAPGAVNRLDFSSGKLEYVPVVDSGDSEAIKSFHASHPDVLAWNRYQYYPGH